MAKPNKKKFVAKQWSGSIEIRTLAGEDKTINVAVMDKPTMDAYRKCEHEEDILNLLCPDADPEDLRGISLEQIALEAVMISRGLNWTDDQKKT